jgi:hypothetical protein
MNRKTVMIAIAVVVALLVGVAGYLLYQGISRFGEAEEALNNAKLQLRRLYGVDPFPSDANIAIERKNESLLRDWTAELLRNLGAGQVEPVRSTPSQFARLLGQTRGELMAAAVEHEVQLPDPETFGFGFARYFEEGSALPDPEAVPRLGQQLSIITAVCRMLFEAGVDRLESVERQAFEGETSAGPDVNVSVRGGGRSVSSRASLIRRASSRGPGQQALAASPDAGRLTEGDLFATLRFKIEMVLKADALLRFLNRLASDDMFVVVTDMHLSKPVEDVLDMTGTAGISEAAARTSVAGILASPVASSEPGDVTEIPPRIQRLVSGPDIEVPMRVVIAFDVYRFQESN